MRMLEKWATSRNILLLLGLFLLFNFVLIPVLYPKFQTLDTLGSYSPQEAYRLLASYGDQGRQQYLVTELTLDVLYPLSTALFFGLLTLYSFRQGFPDHPWTRWLVLIPLAELAVDFLENASIVVMLARYPAEMPLLAAASNVFTTLKFALTLPELAFVVGLVAWLIRSLRRRAAPMPTRS